MNTDSALLKSLRETPQKWNAWPPTGHFAHVD